MKSEGKHHKAKRHVGVAISLEKFASAKKSTYDKRQVLEKQRALKAKQVNKYQKLKKRLENEGKLQQVMVPPPLPLAQPCQYPAISAFYKLCLGDSHEAANKLRGPNVQHLVDCLTLAFAGAFSGEQ
eukprot:jgi/Chrzof1/452/Cz01g16110.t1